MDRAWLLLGGVGLGLLVLSVAVADQLARSLVRPLTAVAQASDRLAAGDLSARATVAGPPEVRRAGAGLNRLAARIGELLAHERETRRRPVAPAAHPADRAADRRRVAAGRREMARIWPTSTRWSARSARSSARPGGRPARRAGACDAAEVVARARGVLAAAGRGPGPLDDASTSPPGRCRSRRPREDLAACADILLENVFAHTPEGAGAHGPGQPPGGRRRVAGRRRRRARLPAPASPRSAACPARARPASAWTSPGGSPRCPAARWPWAGPHRRRRGQAGPGDPRRAAGDGA